MPYAQCNGAELYFEDNGSGRPLVFLPGVTASVRFFDPQLSDLSKEYRTVALDYRGHGRSEKTETGHTVPQYARDVRALLDHLRLDGVVFVGWSMGALVAWEYVDQFGPDNLRGLVAIDMSASAFAWDDFEHGSSGLDQLRGILELSQADAASLIERFIEQAFKRPSSPETRSLAFDECTRVPPSIRSAILVDYTLRDYRDVLTRIDVPALVCGGADETWRTVAAVRDVADRLQNAEFEVFEESGHVLSLEEPERLSRSISTFVESL